MRSSSVWSSVDWTIWRYRRAFSSSAIVVYRSRSASELPDWERGEHTTTQIGQSRVLHPQRGKVGGDVLRHFGVRSRYRNLPSQLHCPIRPHWSGAQDGGTRGSHRP